MFDKNSSRDNNLYCYFYFWIILWYQYRKIFFVLSGKLEVFFFLCYTTKQVEIFKFENRSKNETYKTI